MPTCVSCGSAFPPLSMSVTVTKDQLGLSRLAKQEDAIALLAGVSIKRHTHIACLSHLLRTCETLQSKLSTQSLNIHLSFIPAGPPVGRE